MARDRKTADRRLHKVPEPERLTSEVTIMAFRTPAGAIELPLSGEPSEEAVERARELARKIGWKELFAS
jgi:hypothetical protein